MLRIEIDGPWTAQDFVDQMSAVQDVYRSFVYLAIARRPYRYLEDFYFTERYLPFDRLDVRRISYASPGFQDFIGLGAALREVRELIQFWVVHFREREDREIMRERSRLEIDALRIDNTRRFVQLCQEAHIPPEEIERQLLRLDPAQNALASLAARKQITGAHLLVDEQREPED